MKRLILLLFAAALALSGCIAYPVGGGGERADFHGQDRHTEDHHRHDDGR